MGSFAWIKIHVLRINGSLGYHKRNVHSVHIFVHIYETRITQKYIQRENFYVHSTSCGKSIWKNIPG